MERKFEEATDYLFEAKLNHKPLNQIGSNHPDGVIRYKDSLILWDNKSKESAVNLKVHLKQFDRYVQSAEKRVGCFLVIGPGFTEESRVLAMQYLVENDTPIPLITADELKTLAEDWDPKRLCCRPPQTHNSQNHSGRNGEPPASPDPTESDSTAREVCLLPITRGTQLPQK